MTGDKLLLRKLGEETLYSSKGHFKASDLRRNLVLFTIWICVILSILDLMGVFKNDTWLDAMGLFGGIALLLWNEGEGKDYKTKHKEIGEKYLNLHKQIRACYIIDTCDEAKITELNNKVIEMDAMNRPDIPWAARMWAKYSIEKWGETDNWFSTTN